MTEPEPPHPAPSADREPSAAVYDAFISYSHQLDGDLAAALQSALHRDAKPWYRLPARCESPIRDVTYDAAGERLAVGLSNGTIRVVDASTRRPLVELSTDVSGPLYSVAMRPDGEVVATGHTDGTVGLWDLQTEQQVGDDLVFGPGDVRAVAFSPDGSLLASGTEGSVVLWTVGIDALRERACALAGRNLSPTEWRRLYGSDAPYRPTCPG